MVIDSSALLAVVLEEPDGARYLAALEGQPIRLMSLVNWVETCFVVLTRKGPGAFPDLDLFVEKAAISVVPNDAAQGVAARTAFARFGKGRHPAGLNLGDCFAYALAHTTGEKLLFKGNDFPKTDIAAVL